MSTIILTSDHTVGAAENLVFTAEPAFQWAADVDLTNLGKITVNYSGANVTAFGVVADTSVIYQNGAFTNAAAAEFRVTATGSGATAIGYYAGSFGTDIVNDGLWVVTSAGTACGVSMNSDAFGGSAYIFRNTGSFTVTAGEYATGVIINNGGDAYNSGSMLVSGQTGGVGVFLGQAAARFDNAAAGTLTVTDGTAAIDNVAVQVANFLEFTLTNAGLIQGDYAVLTSSNTATAVQVIQNSGQMHGIVALAGGNDQVTNTGSMTGDLLLGEGADMYAGASGTHAGVVFGGGGDDTLTGGAGAETIFGQMGVDAIDAGGGNDLVSGGRGADNLDGGGGFDTLTFADATMRVLVNLAAGTADSSGADTIAGFERVVGGDYGDTLTGGTGGDTLEGLGGADVLSGAAGADVLWGGRGVDQMSGGSGDDTFVFAAGDGADVVTDFVAGAGGDALRIYGYTAYQQLVQEGANTRVVLSATDSILLTGVNSGSLVAGDFQFNAGAPPAADPVPPAIPSGATFYDSFTVYAGESFSLTEGWRQDGFTGGAGPLPGFYCYGAVEIQLAADASLRVGLATSANTSEVVIGAGGVFRVVSTTAGLGVTGSSGPARSFSNAGLFEVDSAGDARGFDTSEGFPFAFTNTGDFITTAAGEAIGALFANGAAFVNTGLIETTGSTQASGVRLFGHEFTFDNSGTIRVEDDTEVVNSVAVAWNRYMGGAVLTNTGLVEGEIAFFDSGGSDDRLINSGQIVGEVRLGGGNDRYEGAAGTQSGGVFGQGGDDVLIAGAGDNLLDGGDGSDALTGGAGDDTFVLLGVTGEEVIEDFVAGGALDRIELDALATYTTVQDGAHTRLVFSGADSILLKNVQMASLTAADFLYRRTGDEQANSLTGDHRADHIIGLAGNDTLKGEGGNDILDGGDDNDVIDGGAGDDLMNGGVGTNDRADYRTAGSAVTVNLALTTAQNTGGAGTDTLTGFEAVIGSAFNDALTGNSGANTLDGRDGNDALYGGSGGDILIGGVGADALDGENGLDYASYINAAAGVSVNLTTGVHGGEAVGDTFVSIERFRLSAQADTFTGGAATDYAYGAEGNDTLNGAGGIDRLYGQAGVDTLNGDVGNDILLGGAGADVHNGGADRDTASYEESTVAITINRTTGVHTGDATGDTWNSVEILWLSAFDDHFTGDAAVDEVRGAAGADVMNGLAGADILRGESGNDSLSGGENDDFLHGGTGADQLNGGNGVDTAVYLLATAGVTINLTTGTHAGEAAGDAFTSIERFQLSNGFTLADSFTGSAGNDWVAGYKGNDTLNGMDGDDTLNGGEHHDTLNGGSGADKLIAGIGNDTLTGGSGSDQFHFNVGLFGADTITDFENGVDFIRITGQAGIDSISDLTITQNGAHVLITLPDGSTITVQNTLTSAIDASDFLWN